MARRALLSSLLIAAWLAPGGASAAVAVHEALHHGPSASAAGTALSALAHGHAHEEGTPEHGHVALMAPRTAAQPGITRERDAVAAVAIPPGIAMRPAPAWRAAPVPVARPRGPDLLARISPLRI